MSQIGLDLKSSLPHYLVDSWMVLLQVNKIFKYLIDQINGSVRTRYLVEYVDISTISTDYRRCHHVQQCIPLQHIFNFCINVHNTFLLNQLFKNSLHRKRFYLPMWIPSLIIWRRYYNLIEWNLCTFSHVFSQTRVNSGRVINSAVALRCLSTVPFVRLSELLLTCLHPFNFKKILKAPFCIILNIIFYF